MGFAWQCRIGNPVRAGDLVPRVSTVFLLTAILCLLAVLAVWNIQPAELSSGVEEHPALMHTTERRQQGHPIWALYTEAHLHWFALCILLFHVANAVMLSLAVNALAARRAGQIGVAVSAAILVSQVVVAILSARFGREAQQRGRRPLLLLGFAVLPIRGLVLAILPGVIPLVCAEALDGIIGAVMGIMVPLVSADLTCRTGFLNMAIGSLGFAAGIGATVSTALGAWLADRPERRTRCSSCHWWAFARSAYSGFCPKHDHPSGPAWPTG